MNRSHIITAVVPKDRFYLGTYIDRPSIESSALLSCSLINRERDICLKCRNLKINKNINYPHNGTL